MDDAFDPEKYAARLEAMEAVNPVDGGLGGRRGRPLAASDARGPITKRPSNKKTQQGRSDDGGSVGGVG